MDRTFQGFIAGCIGGVCMNVINLTAYYGFHLVKIRFLDWAAVLFMRGLPVNFWETVAALVMQLLWNGMLGITFALLLPLVSRKGYLIKGALYGICLSYIFTSLVAFFNVKFLSEKIDVSTLSINQSAVIVWGLVTAFVFGRFELREQPIEKN